MMPSRLGSWAATLVAVIGVAYLVVLGVGMAQFGLERPIPDPVLAVMEVLTLLSAPAILIALAAVREGAARDRRLWGTVSLSFAILFTGLTSAVDFVELTAVRQAGGGGIAWPSSAYAAELLAWDWFLGLALLFAAPVLAGEAPAVRRVRRMFWFAGSLCLVGTLGPLAGAMAVQRVGILGYALALPVAFLWLARLLRLAPSSRSAV